MDTFTNNMARYLARAEQDYTRRMTALEYALVVTEAIKNSTPNLQWHDRPDGSASCRGKYEITKDPSSVHPYTLTAASIPSPVYVCNADTIEQAKLAAEEDHAISLIEDLGMSLQEAKRESHRQFSELVSYVLQDEIHNRLTPRVTDICYSVFMTARDPNPDDGGPRDWLTDTYPFVKESMEKIKKDLLKVQGLDPEKVEMPLTGPQAA